MPLLRRLNIILLPVIILVFGLAALILNEGYERRLRQETASYWRINMLQFQKSLKLERQSLQASLTGLLGQPVLYRYLNAADPSLYATTIEDDFSHLLDQAQQITPGLSAIQVLSHSGDILLSAPVSQPRLAPTAQLNLTSINDAVLRERITLPGEEKLQYELLQSYFPVGSSRHYMAILESELLSGSPFVQELERDYGEDYAIRFEPVMTHRQPAAMGTDDNNPVTITRGTDNELILSLNDPLYQLSLSIASRAIEAGTVRARVMLFGTLLALVLISFFSLRLLIRRQIVGPINQLTRQVEQSQQSGQIYLSRRQGADEVSRLNNAYLGLVENIRTLAATDQLTGLASRDYFWQQLSQRLADAPKQQLALLYINLDNFKQVNDHSGHAAGDRLLLGFAQSLLQLVQQSDAINHTQTQYDCQTARLGGDEFAVLLDNLTHRQQAGAFAQQILALLENGCEVDGIMHNGQASIGIAFYPDDSTSANQLLANGDDAMQQAKAEGKGRLAYYSKDISEDKQHRQHIEQVLLQSLNDNSFELVYMPICETQSRRLAGAEVLLRCSALSAQGIGPDQFIPVAESTGLIRQIDLWVLENALAQLKQLQQDIGYRHGLAVNISANELHNPQFPAQVEQLLLRYKTDPTLIELEITETSLVSSDSQSIQTLLALKALGLKLSLDDFGTGYTAFTQLANYPVDFLKVDRMFVNQLSENIQDKQAMLDIILALARMYNLQVVAEGVETAEQLSYLQRAGCDYVQGYFLSKPLGFEQMRDLAQTSTFERK